MSIRHKTVLVSTVLGLAAAPAFAQLKTAGNLEIYGRAHLSIDSLDDGAQYNRINLSSNASRLGLRGSKNFGDLTGIWQIEQEVFFNNNSTDNRFATRDTFAGVQGSFGQFRVGKFDTPFKVARGPADLFSDQLGDMRNVTRAGTARFDERPNNIVEYQSPNLAGIRLRLAYAPHENTSATVTNGVERRDAVTSGSVQFTHGPFDSTLAYESYERDATNGKRDATRFAVSYRLSNEFRLVGFLQDASHTPTGVNVNESGKVTGFGAEYQLTPALTLRAHMLNRDADRANGDADLYAIGLERLIDRSLRFYINYGQVNNESASAIVPWVQGRSTTQAGTKGSDARGVSLGMRYDF